MDTLKMKTPEGYKFDTFNSKTNEVYFKPIPKDIKERIKTFGDVLEYHGIDSLEWTHSIIGLSSDEVAFRQIKLIAEALNEGWTPNWGDSNEYKYYPWFNMGGSSGSGFSFGGYDYDLSLSAFGSRLCFKSRELTEYAGEQFTEIYKTFLTLQKS